MKRRAVIQLLAGLAAVGMRQGHAQEPRTARVGLLTPGPPLGDGDARLAALTRALAQQGYVVGRNLTIEQRAARGRVHDLPRLAQELAAAKADVIVTNGFPPAAAAKATGVPTVAAAGVGDPVATGLVESLARPGANLTGISDDASELSTKRLSLLKELLPGLRRVAMLWNEDDLGMSLRYKASAQAADGLGVAVQALGIREPDDFNAAFAAIDRERPDAILMVSDSLTVLNRRRVFDYAAAHRLPAMYESAIFVRDGGLTSYGADEGESYVRAAALVHDILKGTSPAVLPFERPTRYSLAINLQTAKAIGFDVPPLLLARADEVVE
jgi:putative ABC transport system substrate-binding protein